MRAAPHKLPTAQLCSVLALGSSKTHHESMLNKGLDSFPALNSKAVLQPKLSWLLSGSLNLLFLG